MTHDDNLTRQALTLLSRVDPGDHGPEVVESYADALRATTKLADALDAGGADDDGTDDVPTELRESDGDPVTEYVDIRPDTRSHQALWVLALWHDEYGRDHYATADDVMDDYGDPFETRHVLSAALSKNVGRYGVAEGQTRPKSSGKTEYRITERGIEFLRENGYPEGKYGVPESYQRSIHDGA